MTSMRRAGVALVLIVLASAARPAWADDRTSVEAGRAMGRALLVLREPAACAIALLRERCRADVEAFIGTTTDAEYAKIPHIGPHPITGLRAFVATGDRDAFDRALVYINARSSTPAMWTADPRNAALYDAGIEEVLHAAAGGDMASQILGGGSLMDLMDHAGAIPAGVLGVNVPRSQPGTPIGGTLLRTADALVRATETALPSPPLAALPQRDDPAGVAALGVASSTVVELIDSPEWLFQADAQRYVDAFVARMTVFAPAATAQLAELRAATRPGPGFSHEAAIRAYDALIGPAMAGPRSRAVQFMLGAMAAQMTFNAAVLRDAGTARMLLGVTADNAAIDDAVPGWASARAGARGIGTTSWSAQYALGVRLVGLIEKANGS